MANKKNSTAKTTRVKKSAVKARPETGLNRGRKSTSTSKNEGRSPAVKKKSVGNAQVKKSVKKSTPPAVRANAPKLRKKERNGEGYELALAVASGILEKKGENIVCLDLRNIENAVCDYFIICEGNSSIQVEAIADSVEETVKKRMHQRPYRSEGWQNALWILIDFVNVVVHVFQKDTRQFYNLESLWADAEEVKFDELKRA
ncbi:MAG TPA: ribosome silencing factor [Bacteroidia bacterium]|nr:ribosome silencing factor [Bacteroidia bacterium]